PGLRQYSYPPGVVLRQTPHARSKRTEPGRATRGTDGSVPRVTAGASEPRSVISVPLRDGQGDGEHCPGGWVWIGRSDRGRPLVPVRSARMMVTRAVPATLSAPFPWRTPTMLRSKFFTAALVAATALLAAPATSQAAFQISVNDGAGDSFLANITTTGLVLVSGTGTTATQAGLNAAVAGYFYTAPDPTVPGAASASFTLHLGEYTIASQFALTNGNAPGATGSNTIGALRISNTS